MQDRPTRHTAWPQAHGSSVPRGHTRGSRGDRAYRIGRDVLLNVVGPASAERAARQRGPGRSRCHARGDRRRRGTIYVSRLASPAGGREGDVDEGCRCVYVKRSRDARLRCCYTLGARELCRAGRGAARRRAERHVHATCGARRLAHAYASGGTLPCPNLRCAKSAPKRALLIHQSAHSLTLRFPMTPQPSRYARRVRAQVLPHLCTQLDEHPRPVVTKELKGW